MITRAQALAPVPHARGPRRCPPPAAGPPRSCNQNHAQAGHATKAVSGRVELRAFIDQLQMQTEDEKHAATLHVNGSATSRPPPWPLRKCRRARPRRGTNSPSVPLAHASPSRGARLDGGSGHALQLDVVLQVCVGVDEALASVCAHALLAVRLAVADGRSQKERARTAPRANGTTRQPPTRRLPGRTGSALEPLRRATSD